MDAKTFNTNYLVAVTWLGGSLILCNEIEQLDQDLYLNLYDSLCYDEDGEDDEDFEGIEVYQWVLTNYSKSDVEWLREHFNLTFVYSELLGLWVLAVTHYGTSWDYVYWVTDIENAKRELGERK